MGHRRSAYPWIQRIPANPQMWYGANVNRLTPNIVSGMIITSCFLSREIEGTYGSLSYMQRRLSCRTPVFLSLPHLSLSCALYNIPVMPSVLSSSPLSPPLIPTDLALYFFEPHNPSDPHHNQMSSGPTLISIFTAWEPCHWWVRALVCCLRGLCLVSGPAHPAP